MPIWGGDFLIQFASGPCAQRSLIGLISTPCSGAAAEAGSQERPAKGGQRAKQLYVQSTCLWLLPQIRVFIVYSMRRGPHDSVESETKSGAQ